MDERDERTDPAEGADQDDRSDAVDRGDLDEWASELDVDETAIAREEAIAARRASSIEAGRRIGGAAGAAMAGAMLALRDIYEGPPPEEAAEVQESPDDPTDIDTDGISMRIGDVDVWAPPQPRPDDAE
ncbi:MAG: hypothetical protein AAGF91_02935 [Actinomycetota bacterium]